ncbi:hypothetical protein M8494_13945 [Serratia ureilytica]
MRNPGGALSGGRTRRHAESRQRRHLQLHDHLILDPQAFDAPQMQAEAEALSVG